VPTVHSYHVNILVGLYASQKHPSDGHSSPHFVSSINIGTVQSSYEDIPQLPIIQMFADKYTYNIINYI
jgi:hypothetical protein